jgi:hypothetical protein
MDTEERNEKAESTTNDMDDGQTDQMSFPVLRGLVSEARSPESYGLQREEALRYLYLGTQRSKTKDHARNEE